MQDATSVSPDRVPDATRRREHLLEGENEVLKLIIDRAPLPAVLDALTRVAERQSTGGLLASILLLDSDGVHLRHGAAPSLPGDYSRAIDGITIGPRVGSCGTAAYLRKQIIVSDILHDPLWTDFRELAARHGLRACWSTPILSGKRSVLGTFALYYREVRSPDEDDTAMIDILTRTAALAIEHARAENELAESEERFRSLSRCAPLGVFMIDSAGAFSYVNPRFIEISGFEYEKTFDYWLETATGDIHMADRWRNAMRVRTEYSDEFTISREGTERTVSLRMAPMRSQAGSYLGYVGTLEDVSAQISGELALQKETSLRRAIEESVPSGIAAVSPDRTQMYVNRAFAEMVGWPVEELVGAKAPFVYWPDEEREHIENALAATLNGTAPRQGFELRFKRKSGELFDALVTIAPLNDQSGQIAGWVASVSDITELKRTEHRLLESEERLKIAWDAAQMGAWEWDVATGRVSWSPQLETIHGIAPGSFGGTFEAFQSDIDPADRARVVAAIQDALARRAAYRVEYEIIRPDGTRSNIEARGRVLCDSSGNPAKMVGICMDVTEHRAAAPSA